MNQLQMKDATGQDVKLTPDQACWKQEIPGLTQG